MFYVPSLPMVLCLKMNFLKKVTAHRILNKGNFFEVMHVTLVSC